MRLAEGVRLRLADTEPEVRRRAVQEIPSLPAPDSCELLLVALGDDDWRVRKEAASVAMTIEPRTAVVFALARALAERDNIGLRNAAVEGLILVGPDAIPGAIDALGRLDPDGRKLAVEVLAGVPTLPGMKAVLRASYDADVNVVVAAAEALGRAALAGEEAREMATARLMDLLEPSLPSVCLAALDALRALESPVPWSRLEPLFGDSLCRRSAVAAAGGATAPRALLALAEALAEPSSTIAREAMISLGRSLEEAWDDHGALEIAARTLRASAPARARVRAFAKEVTDPEVRAAALLALGLMRDPDDVALVADALADDDVADRAGEVLRMFGHDAIELLLVAGRTAAPSFRAAAISMLPELAPAEPSPLAAVREAIDETSAEVVAPALKSLAIAGGAADLAAVARHVSSADSKIASAAHSALFAIASRHVGAARELIRDVDPRADGALVAAIVLDAIADVGSGEPRDVEFLVSALTHREATVRRAAIDALARIGGEEAARAVTVSLADEEAMVGHAAIRALGRLGRAEQLASLAATTRDPTRLGTVLRALKDADPERAFAAARPLLRSREPSVSAVAVEVVGSVKLAGNVEALMSAVDHPNHEIVKLVLSEIAKHNDERAFAALGSAIDHPAESVRRCAAELLGQMRIDGRVAADAEVMLRARLDRERRCEVRDAIMRALAARARGGGDRMRTG